MHVQQINSTDYQQSLTLAKITASRTKPFNSTDYLNDLYQKNKSPLTILYTTKAIVLGYRNTHNNQMMAFAKTIKYPTLLILPNKNFILVSQQKRMCFFECLMLPLS
ncbi:unnamed protein product [Musa banksii]